MKKNLSYLSAAVWLFVAITASASAATFLMRFEVTNFGSLNDYPPPTDPVIGTITWEAADIHAPILLINSIDMTIAGHPYSIGEITYVPPGYPEYNALIGGSLSGPFTMNDLTDDFWIRWDQAGSLLPYDFAYTSSATSGMWYTLDWGGLNPSGFFSITEVPEPSPTVTCSVQQPVLWPPNKKLVNVGLLVTALDYASTPLPATLQVFCNENVGGAVSMRADTLQLRADRVGNANDGRVYLILAKAADSFGSVGFASCTVVVSHDGSPRSVSAVTALAADAKAYCDSHNGTSPPGYFLIGGGSE